MIVSLSPYVPTVKQVCFSPTISHVLVNCGALQSRHHNAIEYHVCVHCQLHIISFCWVLDFGTKTHGNYAYVGISHYRKVTTRPKIAYNPIPTSLGGTLVHIIM